MAKNDTLKAVETDESTETTDERLAAHRESVRKGAAARKAAVERLVAKHKEEFSGYLEEEKEARGIRSWEARKKERAQRDFLRLLEANPELAELIHQAS